MKNETDRKWDKKKERSKSHAKKQTRPMIFFQQPAFQFPPPARHAAAAVDFVTLVNWKTKWRESQTRIKHKKTDQADDFPRYSCSSHSNSARPRRRRRRRFRHAGLKLVKWKTKLRESQKNKKTEARHTKKHTRPMIFQQSTAFQFSPRRPDQNSSTRSILKQFKAIRND